MSEQEKGMHFVSTYDEAKTFIEQNDTYWISDCGCRKEHSGCTRSRADVCLGFREGATSTDSGLRRASRADAMALLKEAFEKKLVTRPFRSKDRTEVYGICFCCDCCCGYFVDPDQGEYVCDKGDYIEQTDLDSCTHCGVCADVCYFKEREMVDDQLVITRQNCYGCGLCERVCPEHVVGMEKRH